VLLHALAKYDNLSILGQLHFDNILGRLVHPTMLPCRIKDIGVTTAGPYAYPVGLVVIPFLDFPDSAKVKRRLLRLSLRDSRFRKSGTLASR
jgi:hypothetical protein